MRQFRCPSKSRPVTVHPFRLACASLLYIAIAPSGVFVIDAKRYKGRSRFRKPLFRDAKLAIRGRDKTKLVDGLKRQVDAVRAA